MLRTNLSTRPFYNEPAVRVFLGLATLLVVAMTIFNAVRYVSLSAREQELSVRANEALAEAGRLRTEAQRIRSQVDPKELETVSAAAREANALIAQRTFSWVQLLAQIEAALPGNVRLVSIEPRVDKGVISVTLAVEARNYEALSKFMEALESRRAFRNVLPPVTSEADDGIIDATVEGTYVPAPRDEAAADGGEPLRAESTRGER